VTHFKHGWIFNHHFIANILKHEVVKTFRQLVML